MKRSNWTFYRHSIGILKSRIYRVFSTAKSNTLWDSRGKISGKKILESASIISYCSANVHERYFSRLGQKELELLLLLNFRTLKKAKSYSLSHKYQWFYTEKSSSEQ